MSHSSIEQPSDQYLCVSSVLAGSERVKRITDIVQSFGLDARVIELDVPYPDKSTASRNARNTLITGSIGLLVDLKVASFEATGDRLFAGKQNIPVVLLDMDPESHRPDIASLIDGHTSANLGKDKISTLG